MLVLAMLLMLSIVLLMLLALGIFSLPVSSDSSAKGGHAAERCLENVAPAGRTGGAPSDGLGQRQEPWMEVLSWEPRAFLYHNFLVWHFLERMEDPSTSDYRFRRIPRLPWAANPELDSLLSENLEQWPHLNELVQCYKADWVKDENKYGHYESVVSPTFQGQIFEGPDTDIETGFSWHWIYPTCYYSQNWKGKTRARDAALNAIQSPLLDIGIERATGIVWNITGGNDLTLYEVNAAAEVIYDLVDPSANLIFGAVIDQSLSGQVSITLIATGFKRQDESEGRPSQGAQLRHGDNLGANRHPALSLVEGGSVEIPEFLKKKGRSRFSKFL